MRIETTLVPAGGAHWFVEESARARMIVLGASGSGRIGQALLGSTPIVVASHGHCPVVVVRGDEPDPTAPGGDLQLAVIEALKSIYDPEIPVDIYELGLIYDVTVDADGDAVVTMTLTTPHCPVAESMPAEVEMRVLSVPGIRDAEVKLVWEPAWDPSKMSDEARLELGML